MTKEEFVSSLFEIEVNTHIAHLQTTSYSEHKALDEVYKDIVELRDRFIEGDQGLNGIIRGYKSFEIKEGLDPVNYLKDYAAKYKEFRLTLNDGFLQQICDDIIELLNSSVYKLKYLK